VVDVLTLAAIGKSGISTDSTAELEALGPQEGLPGFMSGPMWVALWQRSLSRGFELLTQERGRRPRLLVAPLITLRPPSACMPSLTQLQ
jgi:hypothetical protein